MRPPQEASPDANLDGKERSKKAEQPLPADEELNLLSLSAQATPIKSSFAKDSAASTLPSLPDLTLHRDGANLTASSSITVPIQSGELVSLSEPNANHPVIVETIEQKDLPWQKKLGKESTDETTTDGATIVLDAGSANAVPANAPLQVADTATLSSAGLNTLEDARGVVDGATVTLKDQALAAPPSVHLAETLDTALIQPAIENPETTYVADTSGAKLIGTNEVLAAAPSVPLVEKLDTALIQPAIVNPETTYVADTSGAKLIGTNEVLAAAPSVPLVEKLDTALIQPAIVNPETTYVAAPSGAKLTVTDGVLTATPRAPLVETSDTALIQPAIVNPDTTYVAAPSGAKLTGTDGVLAATPSAPLVEKLDTALIQPAIVNPDTTYVAAPSGAKLIGTDGVLAATPSAPLVEKLDTALIQPAIVNPDTTYVAAPSGAKLIGTDGVLAAAPSVPLVETLDIAAIWPIEPKLSNDSFAAQINNIDQAARSLVPQPGTDAVFKAHELAQLGEPGTDLRQGASLQNVALLQVDSPIRSVGADSRLPGLSRRLATSDGQFALLSAGTLSKVDSGSPGVQSSRALNAMLALQTGSDAQGSSSERHFSANTTNEIRLANIQILGGGSKTSSDPSLAPAETLTPTQTTGKGAAVSALDAGHSSVDAHAPGLSDGRTTALVGVGEDRSVKDARPSRIGDKAPSWEEGASVFAGDKMVPPESGVLTGSPRKRAVPHAEDEESDEPVPNSKAPSGGGGGGTTSANLNNDPNASGSLPNYNDPDPVQSDPDSKANSDPLVGGTATTQTDPQSSQTDPAVDPNAQSNASEPQQNSEDEDADRNLEPKGDQIIIEPDSDVRPPTNAIEDEDTITVFDDDDKPLSLTGNQPRCDDEDHGQLPDLIKVLAARQTKSNGGTTGTAGAGQTQQDNLSRFLHRRIYKVQKGDTLEIVARSELGNIRSAPLILHINQKTLAKHCDTKTPLKLGISIVLPSKVECFHFLMQLALAQNSAILYQAIPIDKQGRFYVCRYGDKLESIARNHHDLQDERYWLLLARLNKLSERTNLSGEPIAKLRRGMRLTLPTPEQKSIFLHQINGGSKESKLAEIYVKPPLPTGSAGSGNGAQSTSADNYQTRIVSQTDVGDVTDDLYLRLELQISGRWLPIVSYEVQDSHSSISIYTCSGRMRKVTINLPTREARELAENDLQANAGIYCRLYLADRMPF